MTIDGPKNEIPKNEAPSSTVSSEALRIGVRPIPTTEPDLNDAVVALIDAQLAESDARLPAPTRERVRATVAAHPDIAEIVVDVSDAVIPIALDEAPQPGSAEDEPGDAAGAPRPEIAARVEAVAGRVRLTGKPIHLESLPVTVAVDAKNLAVDWVEDVDGVLWFDAGRKRPGFQADGELQFDIDDARAMFRAMADAMAKEAQGRVKEVDFDVDIERPMGGEQLVTLTGTLDGGCKFIGLRVSAHVVAALHNASAKVTVRDFSLKTSNPFAKLALFVFRKRIREWASTPFDLIPDLPEDYRVDALELRTRGRAVTATLRIR
ncbi:hypothetical protein [Gulosibacter molinativorax]|uniref:hypothetical protein n=1 Tax=Gulosibacter molinativorax TaxID=256821 RepID=UPI0011B29AFF|nr:hypothetical protein [Gulosibacter molinativorax]QUY63251.1 Hypotetical protein [Gulosibacter molinativorax]